MSNATSLSIPTWPSGERTLSGRDLEAVLDAWLADDLAHPDYVHVHSWTDDEECEVTGQQGAHA